MTESLHQSKRLSTGYIGQTWVGFILLSFVERVVLFQRYFVWRVYASQSLLDYPSSRSQIQTSIVVCLQKFKIVHRCHDAKGEGFGA